ncbi:hypothetical protein SADUNF_Sadunf16G0275900 [Salix dunnii]|uniref:non-specific serine/threonine protein kinase n=1 Tax=Salix dunnii TaxID=1413687 RepID=A0A835MMY7_9ROSI|nr:hypothetical protein SADUNF_Sadunf16G0275900 [Salix dunnii]
MWKGSKKYYRSGPWNGLGFSGAPELRANPVFNFYFVDDGEEVYYTYDLKNKPLFTRIVMNQTTYSRQRYTWNEISQIWVLYATVPKDYCDTYNLCGAHGNCINSQSPVCQCLEKFTPKSPESWNSMDWSQGCVRNKPLDCKKGDGFVKYVGLKLPDATNSWVSKTMNLKECRSECLQNCSCMAYTAANIKEGSGCAIWFGDLIDIRQFPVAEQEIYIRMNASESTSLIFFAVLYLYFFRSFFLINHQEAKAASKKTMAVGIALSIFLVCGMLLVAHYMLKRKAKLIGKFIMTAFKGNKVENNQIDSGEKEDLELPLFQFTTIAKATNDFSFNNKIGEGGFGPVYKAWRLWKDGKPLELIEALPGETCNLSEVTRCINISLLCVQQHPDDRPSMSTVVWMLGGENTLPQPKEPGFFKGSGPYEPSSSSSNIELSSANEITTSLMYPR